MRRGREERKSVKDGKKGEMEEVGSKQQRREGGRKRGRDEGIKQIDRLDRELKRELRRDTNTGSYVQ